VVVEVGFGMVAVVVAEVGAGFEAAEVVPEGLGFGLVAVVVAEVGAGFEGAEVVPEGLGFGLVAVDVVAICVRFAVGMALVEALDGFRTPMDRSLAMTPAALRSSMITISTTCTTYTIVCPPDQKMASTTTGMACPAPWSSCPGEVSTPVEYMYMQIPAAT
jgi:hypothetical protein